MENFQLLILIISVYFISIYIIVPSIMIYYRKRYPNSSLEILVAILSIIVVGIIFLFPIFYYFGVR